MQQQRPRTCFCFPEAPGWKPSVLIHSFIRSFTHAHLQRECLFLREKPITHLPVFCLPCCRRLPHVPLRRAPAAGLPADRVLTSPSPVPGGGRHGPRGVAVYARSPSHGGGLLTFFRY